MKILKHQDFKEIINGSVIDVTKDNFKTNKTFTRLLESAPDITIQNKHRVTFCLTTLKQKKIIFEKLHPNPRICPAQYVGLPKELQSLGNLMLYDYWQGKGSLGGASIILAGHQKKQFLAFLKLYKEEEPKQELINLKTWLEGHRP